MKYARVITLGCRLNHADTALLNSRLQQAGYTLIGDESISSPDLIVLNSCAITAEAERKSRQQLRKLKREYPRATIAITGCAAEADPQRSKECGADIIWTNPDKKTVFQKCAGTLSKDLPQKNFSENTFAEFPFRTRAFIKIQEGCDNNCSYCIVPAVRGKSRSRDFAECLADCRHAIENGFPEIVLTGVNTCNYCDEDKNLAALIRQVALLPGNFRIRLSSTEPHPDDLILPHLIADPANRLCRFLHLSMQHGSDRILQAMYRKYTAEQFMDFVRKTREIVPDIHIGTDFIVGFPGETDDDFAQLLQVAENVQFANIHAFAYSPRPGTPAAELPGRVAPDVVKKRMQLLRSAARKSARAFAETQIGKTLPVIFERKTGNTLHGWSDNYLAVTAPAEQYPCGMVVNIVADEKNLMKNLQSPLSGDIL